MPWIGMSICTVVLNLLVLNLYLDHKEKQWFKAKRKRWCTLKEEETGLCMKTDKQIVHGALMARCRTLERVLDKKSLSTNERLVLQDEYERTFALTGHFKR